MNYKILPVILFYGLVSFSCSTKNFLLPTKRKITTKKVSFSFKGDDDDTKKLKDKYSPKDPNNKNQFIAQNPNLLKKSNSLFGKKSIKYKEYKMPASYKFNKESNYKRKYKSFSYKNSSLVF